MNTKTTNKAGGNHEVDDLGGGKTTRKRTLPSTRVAPDLVEASPSRVADLDRVGSVSLVQRTVDALRKAILDAPCADHFLGSEEQLIAALGVSRPTFRQAANLLSHESLLVIKRGMGGGFFTRTPSGDAVSRTAAIYLNAQGTSMRQIHDVLAPLQTEAAWLIASNPDMKQRSRLIELVDSWGGEYGEHANLEAVRRALAFERLLAACCGNPAIELMMNTMLDLVRDARRVEALRTEDRVGAYEAYQRRLAVAVLEGDSEMALLICRRYLGEVKAWLPNERLDIQMKRPR